MRTMIVDNDVVSYIYKKDTRAEMYEPHLVNAITSISFMTLRNWSAGLSSGIWARRDMRRC
jgi:hypothetical protein